MTATTATTTATTRLETIVLRQRQTSLRDLAFAAAVALAAALSIGTLALA